jgi:hypothetical protein
VPPYSTHAYSFMKHLFHFQVCSVLKITNATIVVCMCLQYESGAEVFTLKITTKIMLRYKM